MGNALKRTYKHDPDDGWRMQNEQMKTNPVYKLANLNKGGMIIDIYMEGGIEAVEVFAREKLEHFLYYGGKGSVIRKVDYARFITKCQATAEMSSIDGRTEEEVLAEFRQTGFNKVEDHEACWDLNQRGAVGETLLHLLYLNGTPIHIDIATLLLEIYPKLSLDVYEGDEYFGESCLHLAIVFGDILSVKNLVEAGANIAQRATGSFFLPEDQKKKINVTKTNYEGYSYYGEFPLAFAACHGHEAIYDFLIEQGADPNAQDSFGNTVLHMVVICNMVEMYTYAVRHHKKRANDHIQNHAGLTPLTLACKLGRPKIFSEITHLSNKELWRYSNVSCSVYPLEAIDTIGPKGTTNFNSALMIIVNGEKDEHLEMLEGGVIRQLLDEKWNYFARRHFFRRLALTTVHMILMSIAVYTRPKDSLDPNNPDGYLLERTDGINILRYVCEAIVCGGSIWTFVLQWVEIKSVGLIRFLKNLKNAPAKAIFMVASILIIMCVPFRFLHLPRIEESLLILSLPGTWSFYLFYAKGLKLTGPFVTMIYKIFLGDMFRFFIIYLVFLVMFVQVFFMLYKDIDLIQKKEMNITTFESPGNTIMSLIQMTLGDFKYSEFDSTKNPYLTKVCFTLFMFLVPILLLNMLIAMMGQTYQQVISKSEKEWRRQWAKIVIVLERAFKSHELMKIQNMYSIPLPIVDLKNGEGEVVEPRGITVIATSKKTKARQKKGAISNWKWMYKETRKYINTVRQIGRLEGPIEYFDVFESEEGRLAARKLKHGRPGSAASNHSFSQAIAQLAWEKDIDINVIEEMKQEIDRRKSVGNIKSPPLQDFARLESIHRSPTRLPSLSGSRKSSIGNQESVTSPRRRAIKKSSKTSLCQDWDLETKEALLKDSTPKSAGRIGSGGKRSSKVVPLMSTDRQDSSTSFSSVLDALDRSKENSDSLHTDTNTEMTDM